MKKRKKNNKNLKQSTMTHRRAPLRELRRVGNLSLGHFVSSETSFCIWYFAWWL